MKKTLFFHLFILLSVCALSGCGSSNKKASDELDEDTSEAVEGLSDEEKAELKERQKKNIQARGKLGKFLKEKRYRELRDEASKILSARPNDLKALSALAIYHMQKGEHGAARIFFDRALKKHPNEAGIYNNFGVMDLKEGELASAFSNFTKAYQLSNSNPNVLTNLGSIYVKYMDYVEAEAMVEDAYSYLPGNTIVANNYAIILRTQGQFEEAEKIYKKTLAKDPRSISTNLNYAILLIEYMKDYDKARQVTNKLEFLNPTDRYTVKKIGELQRKAQTAK